MPSGPGSNSTSWPWNAPNRNTQPARKILELDVRGAEAEVQAAEQTNLRLVPTIRVCFLDGARQINRRVHGRTPSGSGSVKWLSRNKFVERNSFRSSGLKSGSNDEIAELSLDSR